MLVSCDVIMSLSFSMYELLLELALLTITISCFAFSLHNISRDSLHVLSRGIYAKGIRYKFIICLRVSNIPREDVKMQRQGTPENSDNVTQYVHQHLTSMWKNVKEASYEIHVREEGVEIYFYAHHSGFKGEKCFKEAWKKMHSLKISLETRFPNIETKIQEFEDLKKRFNIFDFTSKMKTKKNFVIFKKNGSETWMSVTHIKGKIECTPQEKYSQIDSLVRGLTRLGMDAHFIVHFKAVKPPKTKNINSINKKLKTPKGEVLVQINEDKLDEKEKEIGHITGYWNVSSYVVIKTNTEKEAEIRTTQVKNILNTVYSGSHYSPDIKTMSGREVKRKLKQIVLRKSVGRTEKMASTRLAALTHFPERPVPGIETYECPDFEIPPQTIFNYYKGIPISYVLYKDREIFTCMLDPEDLRCGLAVLGTVGSGKTYFVMNLIDKLLRRKQLPMLIFESKGEFAGLAKSLPPEIAKNILIICPGSKFAPLKINLFDPGDMDAEDYARRLYGLIDETLHSLFRIDGDLSLQMSRVLSEVLPQVIKEERYRNFDALGRLLGDYAESKRQTAPFVDSTILALDARLGVFRQGILGSVFNVNKSNISLDDLLKKVIIIDFSYLLSQGGTKEDMQVIMNLIMLHVFQAGLRRINVEELKHLVVVDDARFLVPEIFRRRSSGDTTIVEDMITIERGKGQGLVLICQDPAISKVVLANCNTRVVFRIAFKSPEEEEYIGLGLNIADTQKSHLVAQPRREAIMKLAEYPYPFRIRTLNYQCPKITFQDIEEHNRKYHKELYVDEEIEQEKMCELELNRDEKNINEILSWILTHEYITVDTAKELVKLDYFKTRELLDALHKGNGLLKTTYFSPISGKQILYYTNDNAFLAFIGDELKKFALNNKLDAPVQILKKCEKNKIIQEVSSPEFKEGAIVTFEGKTATQIKEWLKEKSNNYKIVSFNEKGLRELKTLIERLKNKNNGFRFIVIGRIVN